MFKGFETFVPQGIGVITDNVRFLREKFYSPSTGKIYPAPLPSGYEGAFSPDLKKEVLSLYFDGNMSQPRILSWLTNKGIDISAGTVSSIITNRDSTYSRTFYQECAEIFREGLKSTIWQATDHTSTRVDGEEWQCQVSETSTTRSLPPRRARTV